MTFYLRRAMRLLVSMLFLLSVISPARSIAGSLLNDLTPVQIEELNKGRQVVLTEEISGLPWPRMKIFQRVKACPEEVAAVFFDYKEAKTYVPKVVKSEVVKTVSPCVLEVEYGVDVPLLPNEYYATRNSLTENAGSYRVDWVLLRALQTKFSEGNLRVEHYGDESVICYTNLVTPGSKMAVLLRLPAMEQMKGTVAAIVNQVEHQKSANPTGLEKQVSSMRSALKEDPGHSGH